MSSNVDFALFIIKHCRSSPAIKRQGQRSIKQPNTSNKKRKRKQKTERKTTTNIKKDKQDDSKV